MPIFNAASFSRIYLPESEWTQLKTMVSCGVHSEEDRSLKLRFTQKQLLFFPSHHPLEHKLGVIRILNHQAETVPILLEHPPQNATRDTVKCLLQVHKAHVNWLGKLPWTFEHPAEGIELVQCSTARTKTALFLLDPRFDYRPNSPLQYPGIDFPGEAEDCDPPIVGTHPPVPLFE